VLVSFEVSRHVFASLPATAVTCQLDHPAGPGTPPAAAPPSTPPLSTSYQAPILTAALDLACGMSVAEV